MRVIDAHDLWTEIMMLPHNGDMISSEEVEKAIVEAPTVDAVPVVYGRWNLEVRWFYADTYDESIELVIYILASCDRCGRKHPDRHQVFSKTLCPPEDADENFGFDEEAEVAKAISEFKNKGYDFASYCPNCGADMRGERRADEENQQV